LCNLDGTSIGKSGGLRGEGLDAVDTRFDFYVSGHCSAFRRRNAPGARSIKCPNAKATSPFATEASLP